MRAVLAYFLDRGRTWATVFRLARRGGTADLAQSVTINMLIAVLPSVFVVAMGVLFGRIADLGGQPAGTDSTGRLVVPFAAAIGAFVAQQVLLPLQAALGEIIARRVDASCMQDLMRAATVDANVATLERPETLDVLNDARNALNRDLPTPGEAVAGALALIARYGQLLGAVLLVAIALSPGAAVVLTLTALMLRFGQRGSLSRMSGLWSKLARSRRGLIYLRTLGSGPAAAKEIRVLGLLPWLHGIHNRQADEYFGALWRERRRISFRPFLVYAALGLAGAVVVVRWLSGAAANGHLSMLEFGVAVQAVLIPIRFAVFFPECDIQTQFGLEGYRAMLRFEKLAAADARGRSELPDRQDGAATEAPTPGPVGTVRFEDVRFRYNGGPEILRGLTLELKPGTSTAIVGLNGAGKTTLVKLLTRLYEPTSGRITVDGEPLSAMSAAAWQRRLAVIFQDYNRYELSARDNIRMGAPAAVGDPIEAAARRAGALPVLESLAEGPDTVLSGRYVGGQDLSGGQWQRIALARAFYAVEHGAGVLVLDEPTAQLDVRAEAEFFDRFVETTEGLTSVIISHRFSTVRRADQIVVIDGGRVTELGTHEELLARDGTYAGLFRLQAQRFEEANS